MRADCLPFASVTVRVNGEPLTEHHAEGISENDNMTATSFVEAVPGAQFTVNLAIEPGYAYCNRKEKLSFKVSVDGHCIQDVIIGTRTHDLPQTSTAQGLEETNADGGSTRKRLHFAEHTSTDSHAQSSLVEKLAKLGEIKVELTRCRLDGTSNYNPHMSNFKGLNEEPIPEKALKGRAVSNHTSLGRAETIPTIKWVKAFYPFGTAPVATYVFQYRSRRDLEIEGILEREASPVPLEDRDPGELTPDELREQVRLLRQRQRTVEIKQEHKPKKRARARSATLGHDDDDDDEGDVTITSISDRRKRVRASIGDAEVVDLSDD